MKTWQKKLLAGTVVAVVLGGIAAGVLWYKLGQPKTYKPKPLLEVKSTQTIEDSYDVIVTGTDPEGVAAAVSAARNGLKTLLVDGRDRKILGGLMTLGWLNYIDTNESPEKSLIPGKLKILNKGIFQEWFDQFEGTSVDVNTAANVFYETVRKEPNIDLLLQAKTMEPIVREAGGSRIVEGLTVTKPDGTKQTIHAKAVIDATQDADVAAAAGAPFTTGSEDLGDKEARMAVTVVFKLKNVTPEVWGRLSKTEGTGANDRSLWGFTKMWDYKSTQPERVRMRGLNVGRSNDDGAMINAMQIFGIDAFDPKSVRDAYAIADKELPRVLDYMKQTYPAFAPVELAGVAPELYVRETRHLIAEYRLSAVDVLDNRDQWDRIAFGSYPVDIQSTSAANRGWVVTSPEQYAIPFRTLVPQKVDGLLVVGRSAGFDSIPHGSARTIPVGVAAGQAAGAAVKVALDGSLSFRQLSQSKDEVARLQALLEQQDVDLKPKLFASPYYVKHKAYSGLKAMASIGRASATPGDPKDYYQLDVPSNPQSMWYHLLAVKKMFATFTGDPGNAIKGMNAIDTMPLTLAKASHIVAAAAGMSVGEQQALSELEARGWVSADTLAAISDKEKLTNGDTYLLIKDAVKGVAGKTFE